MEERGSPCFLIDNSCYADVLLCYACVLMSGPKKVWTKVWTKVTKPPLGPFVKWAGGELSSFTTVTIKQCIIVIYGIYPYEMKVISNFWRPYIVFRNSFLCGFMFVYI